VAGSPLNFLPTTPKMEMYSIACVIEGEFKPLVIKIGSKELVGTLKVMIQAAATNTFGNVDAHHLKLYQVEISKHDNIARTATQKLAENPAELPDLDELADVFAGGPKKGMVHIIVQRPKSGK